MRKLNSVFFLLVIFCLQITNAATYYVSPSGVSTNSGTSSSSPWPLQYAADRTNAGDVVYLLTGDYILNSTININRSGNSNGYILYAAASGNYPVLKAPNPCKVWNAINVLANYIIIQDIEMVGNNANITLAQAEANYNEAVAGGSNWSKYGETNTNGICVGNHATIVPHHVIVRNCKIHDFSGAGIAFNKTDFVTAENNTVYNNAWYGMYASSGISVFHSQNTITTYTSTANVIRNNIVYNNKALVKWVKTRTYSDGNGIIIDDNKNTQINGTPYKGSTLVENNVSYSNGGCGVYVMSSQHVTLRNNTSYKNSTETANGTGVGELVCYDNNDVTWVNNIAWSNPAYGPEVFAIVDDGAWGTGNTNIIWKNNLSFTGTVGQSGVRIAKTTTTSLDGSNKLGVNPLFVSPTSNFRLQYGSPAVNSGTSAYGTSTTDIAGVARVIGGTIDMGAYENVNLVSNPVFDTNTNGWSLYQYSPAAATIASVTQTGYSGKACKTTITNAGSATWHLQLLQTIPLTAGKTYTVKFKASASAARTIDFMFQQSVSPKTIWKAQYGINLTTTPTTFGPYTFACTTTDASNQFRFLLGANASAVYIDDVEITESTTKSAPISEPDLAETNNNGDLTVFPNPVADVLKINAPAKSNDKISISIIDMQGRIIISKEHAAASDGLNLIETEVQSIPQGSYLVRISTQGVVTSKLVMIRR